MLRFCSTVRKSNGSMPFLLFLHKLHKWMNEWMCFRQVNFVVGGGGGGGAFAFFSPFAYSLTQKFTCTHIQSIISLLSISLSILSAIYTIYPWYVLYACVEMFARKSWCLSTRTRIFVCLKEEREGGRGFHFVLYFTVMNWISRWLIHDCDTHKHTPQ